MKRKILTLSILCTLVMLVALVISTGCKKAGASDLSLIPDDSSAVITINFEKLSKCDFFDGWMKDFEKGSAEKPGKYFKDRQDFINKTGIDYSKDIKSIHIALLGDVKMAEPDMVALIALKYNKEKLISFLKETEKGISEENYNGLTVYRFKDEKQKDVSFSFINSDSIVFGTPTGVKKVVDLSKGKGKSFKDNPKYNAYIGKIKSDSIFSFIAGIPDSAKKPQQENTMFKVDLSKAEVCYGYVDYNNAIWSGLIQLVLKDAAASSQIATMLNGLKGMAAIMGQEAAELVGKINITSSAEGVKMDASIPKDLFEKVKKKMEETMKTLPQPTGMENTGTDPNAPIDPNAAPADDSQPEPEPTEQPN